MKNIFIERQEKLIRVAIKQENILKECLVEEENNNPKVGEIYKGIVRNIVPSIKCAFIDIGYNKNCYMSLEKNSLRTVKKGEEVLVEIVKEEVDKKGPKVSSNISIPGTYVVLTNEHKNIEVSRKIKNVELRDKLHSSIKTYKDLGVVVRTKAEEVSIDMINSEINELEKLYEEIYSKFLFSLKPGLVYSDRGIISRTLRNYCYESKVKIIVNHRDDFEYCDKLCSNKELSNVELELYKGNLELFDYYEIERELICLRHNKISLPSGGNIIIEKTEAMQVIDVNTAQNVKGSSMKETIFNTNMEAAREIIHQVRLRNLGGIIIIDFIDMMDNKCKEEILKTLKKGFWDDKNNPIIYPFTELDLVQINRKRYGKSICDYILESCSCCKGKENKLRLSYIGNIIKGKINKIKIEQQVNNIHLELSSSYEKEIKDNIIEFISSIGALNCNIYITFIENLEGFKVEPIIFHSQLESLVRSNIFKCEDVSLM